MKIGIHSLLNKQNCKKKYGGIRKIGALTLIIKDIIRKAYCYSYQVITMYMSYQAYRHLQIGCVQIKIVVYFVIFSDHKMSYIMTSFSNQNNASAFPLINSKLYFVTELVIGQSAALMQVMECTKMCKIIMLFNLFCHCLG